MPSSEDVAAVREWLDGCEITWMTSASESGALALEAGMKDEFMPPLTHR